jgi:adenylate cyclase
MATLETRYLPADRLRALAAGTTLLTIATGSALFADISGFTPITEKLRQALGARRGAETLASHLNRVYDALIAQVDRFGGSIISFTGDGITCWFEGDDAPLHATACAFALLNAMQTVENIALLDGETASIGLKVSIATGTARRFVVGDPDIQRLDALAGATIARMAAGEGEAERGEVMADTATVAQLGAAVRVRAWREADGERFAVLERTEALTPVPHPVPLSASSLDDALTRVWLLPAVATHFEAGLGEYLTELRPAVALFVRFTGIDYDGDPDAEVKLDRFTRLAQRVVARTEGNVLQLTIGDKGSYLYAAFGAPYAHEDDAARALDAALEIRAGAASLGYLEPLQIGISRGTMRTGAYGGETRRTYGVLGDEVNLASRLMAKAAPGEILVSETVAGRWLDGFSLEALAPVQIKGKANPVRLFRLLGRREGAFEAHFYTTPLVGRESELAMVRAALQPIFEGRHAGVIFIYGEPGMGKSRLAFEAQMRLQAETTVMWLTGQADVLNRAPLSAFSYFLRPYFGQRRDQDPTSNQATFETILDTLLEIADEATCAALTQYRSYLAEIVGLTLSETQYPAADERLRIDNGIEAIKAWARAASRLQPLIIHLEDVHWLDASSTQAIRFLTYNMDDVPLALVLTSRYNDDGSRFMISNLFSVPVQTIDLNRLSDTGVQAVMEAILNRSVSERLAHFVHQRAEGNPFFTEQLTLELRERHALIDIDNTWDIHSDVEGDVPSGINRVLIARLDRLTAQVKAVVQTAAVLGREFDVQVLSRMLRDGEQVYIKAAEAEAIWSVLDTLRYLFRHALLRDAAYQMQVQERLKSLHRLAAETIERLYPDNRMQWDALFQHWQAAGDVERQLHYLESVARRQLEIEGQHEQVTRLADTLRQQLPVGDARHAAPLNWLARAAVTRSDFSVALQHAEAALALAETAHDPVNRAFALFNRGTIGMYQGRYDEAQTQFEQALSLYRDLNDILNVASSIKNLGLLDYFRGSHPQAEAFFQQSLPLYRQIGDVVGEAGALNNIGITFIERAAYDRAREYIQKSLEMRRQFGIRSGVATCLLNLGNIALYEGAYDQAREYYRQALAIEREFGDQVNIGNLLNNLGMVALWQGQYAEARRSLEPALALFRQIDLPDGQSLALFNLGSTALGEKDYTLAEQYLRESYKIGQMTQAGHRYASLGMLVRTLLGRGDLEPAREMLREVVELVQEGDAHMKLEVLGVIAEYRRVMGHWRSAVELSGLILSHPNANVGNRRSTEDDIEASRPHLETAELETALERGKTLNLDVVFASLLTELGQK